MSYSYLKLYRYPHYERQRQVPGHYDPDLVFKSQYLKRGATFPVLHPSNPELASLGRKLGKMLGKFHTSLTIDRDWTPMVRIVPDSGSLQDGVKWILPYVEQFNCVSFDTESCLSRGGISFAIFGTMTGYVLLVDLRTENEGVFPKALWPLIEGRLVIGAKISEDSRILRGLKYKAADVLHLSNILQAHPLYPYQPPAGFDKRNGLKFIPEMMYGHHYGPLAGKMNSSGEFKRKGYPQPFPWPSWAYPQKMYKFGLDDPKQEQIAYMKNDALSPFIHIMLYAMLEVAAGKVKAKSSIQSVLSSSASSWFLDSRAYSSQAPGVACHADKAGIDLYSELGGIDDGFSDEAALEALTLLPHDTLIKISQYSLLDIDDEEDRRFISLFGSLKNLSRCAGLIKSQKLTWLPDKPEVETRRAKSRSSGSPSNRNRSRSELRRSRTPDKAPKADRKCLVPEHSDGTNDSDCCSIKKIEIEIWECTQRDYAMARVPLASGRLVTVKIPFQEPVATTSHSEDVQDKPETAVQDSLIADDNLMEIEETSSSESEEDVESMSPQDVEPRDRLRLLAGKLKTVDLPPNVILPGRFGGTLSFAPRCVQCGHRPRSGKKNDSHPVDACPVICDYGHEAMNPATGVWSALPCLYPLCSRPAHHFTRMCPELHAFCLQCGYRGHSKDRCDIVQTQFTDLARADAYSVFVSFGMRARKASSMADWKYHPSLPEFRLVTSKSKSYLMPWSKTDFEKFEGLSSNERKHMAEHELQC